MAKLKYNRAFRDAIIAILLCVILFSFPIGFFVVSKIQYDGLVADMKSIEATVVDIDLDFHVRGPNEQEITISYEVGGVTYQRELETDTTISFEPGTGAHYSVGDKIQIYYDPNNPDIIASPRSLSVGYFSLVIGLFGLALMLFALIVILKNRHKSLVTVEEYEREKEERKKARRERKELKKKKRAEAHIIVKIAIAALKVLLAAFILLVLLGKLLQIIGK